jgi:hypothetical protein
LAEIYQAEKTGPASSGGCELLIATVADSGTSSTGWPLILPGETEPTTKRYKKLYNGSVANGYKVLVAKVSGTYIIIDRFYP